MKRIAAALGIPAAFLILFGLLSVIQKPLLAQQCPQGYTLSGGRCVASGASGNATQVNGATVPASQPCVGTNSSSQMIAGSCAVSAISYGCVADAATDNTTCINNALAALYTAGGGTLYFPPSTSRYLVNGQITIPNDGGNPPKQRPIRITGVIGSVTNSPVIIDPSHPLQGGSVLELAYTGVNGGRILTTGGGFLEIDHIALYATAVASAKSISAATNAATVTLTSTGHGLGAYATITIKGGTGSWTAINGTWMATKVDANTVTIPVNSTSLGALAGTVTFQATPAVIYDTNTTLLLHDSTIDCGSNIATTNVPAIDAVVLAGTANSTDNTLNSIFGGYGTVIRDNYIAARRAIYIRNAVNSIVISENLLIGNNSDLTSGATVEIAAGTGAYQAQGNTFTSNLIEGPTTYAFRSNSDKGNYVNNTIWDTDFAGFNQTASYRLEGSGNVVVGAPVGTSNPLLSEPTPGSHNTVITDSLAKFGSAIYSNVAPSVKMNNIGELDWTNSSDPTAATVSRLQQWGNGVLTIDNGTIRNFRSLRLGDLYSTQPLAAKTSNYTVSPTDDNGMLFTNVGATGEVDFTLPTAAIGLQFTFVVDAAQTVKIIVTSGWAIRIGASTSATNGNVTCATQGCIVKLVNLGSGSAWVATTVQGTWTVN